MELIYKEELSSTNTYVKEHMEELSHMSFIYCDRQTNGKGRLNRVWVSDSSQNIYLTIVVKPQTLNYPYINLTQYLCVVVCKVLESYGVVPQIKWPNDILVNGKKIAGILAQTSTSGHSINGVALGIGINLNLTQHEVESIDKPATSLNLELDKEVNRNEFLCKLAASFEKDYESFVQGGFSYIEDEYIRHACFLNKEITVNMPAQSLSGTVKNLTCDGALLLCDNETNKDVIITMGEIL